jgi:hypothetical protein
VRQGDVTAPGSLIALYDLALTLEAECPVRSAPFVTIPADGRILGGTYGSLLFAETRINGCIVTQAAGGIGRRERSSGAS